MRSALIATVVLALVSAAAAAGQQPDITPPPPPPENFTPVSIADVLARLPERERAMVAEKGSARDRFERLVEVSDLRLADVGAQLDARAPSVVEGLLLYEAVIRVADQTLRSDEAKVPPRDKRFKRFERRLGRQISTLQSMLDELSYEDSPTGAAVLETARRLRAAALNSALDVDILEAP
jgi:hypothetical protein